MTSQDIYDGVASLGTLERNLLMFSSEAWTPGIWAGTEGTVINYDGRRLKIMDVSLMGNLLIVEDITSEAV